MSPEWWQQQATKPLYPDILWSRPQTRAGAGKLLIIGGQAQEFSHVAATYAQAEANGAGTIRVFLPESTQKLTGNLAHIEYAAANQSGSFASTALADLIEAAQWADGVLLAGDLGKNSETSLMLERFMHKYDGLIAIATHALPSVLHSMNRTVVRPNTLLVLDFHDVQKLLTNLQFEMAITSDMPASHFARALHEFTKIYPLHFVIMHNQQIWTSSAGKVVTTHTITKLSSEQLASVATIWALQQPNKIFESITTAVVA